MVRCDLLEALKQIVRIILDRPHPVGAEQRRKNPLHDRSVLQNVTDPAGRSAVVFQHEIIALAVADQIGAADVDVNISRHGQVEHFPAKHLGAVNQLRRNDFFAQDALLMINVVAEQIQRRDALNQPAFDFFPFVLGNDSGHQIEGEDFFDAALVAVHGEGDALIAEVDVGHLHPAGEGVGAHGRQSGGGRGVMRARNSGLREHLVEQAVDLVGIEHGADSALARFRLAADAGFYGPARPQQENFRKSCHLTPDIRCATMPAGGNSIRPVILPGKDRASCC